MCYHHGKKIIMSFSWLLFLITQTITVKMYEEVSQGKICNLKYNASTCMCLVKLINKKGYASFLQVHSEGKLSPPNES